MKHRRIGATDLSVSELGLGCNGFGSWVDAAETDRIVGTALDHGITFFDTADCYGMTWSETYLARALGPNLNSVVIATKFGKALPEAGLEGGASHGAIERAVEGSLQRLRRDRIDLLQLHFPDYHTPWAETFTALDRLVRDGKVRAIGCCNLMEKELLDAMEVCDAIGKARFASLQFEWSAVMREAEQALVPTARGLGLGLLPYFPLSQGLLTGKYRPETPIPEGSRLARWGVAGQDALKSPRMALAMRLAAFAEMRGRTLTELALGWLLAQVGVASIPAGVSRADQVIANADAISWQPSTDELGAIDQICAEGVL